MKAFDNVTNNGNEKAIRRGRVVPDGDVNLAYVKSPQLNPKDNIVIVDTSHIAEENIVTGSQQRKLYYANPLGMLVDADDNVVVSDQYPIVSDVFSVDEDFSNVPGSEYKDEDVLPFVHVSRHFHLDHAGLTIGSELLTYHHDSIKIVNARGVEYNNYTIKITAAYLPGSQVEGSTWAYRVYAYVDTDQSDGLYLTYTKIELTGNGELVRRKINHKESLNPQPFFDYTPEESDVVDPANREKKIYSTKPVSYKDQVLGKHTKDIDGYKVYVPKKAVGDPRLYQLLRWRIKGTYTQDVTVDPSRVNNVVKCGVLVTKKDLAKTIPSRAPYALYNLERSRYNIGKLRFENPAKTNHSASSKQRRDYWFVNVDTADLSQYDMLIWAPNDATFNFSPYAAKIDNYVSRHGGLLFFDTGNAVDLSSSMGGMTTRAFVPNTGSVRPGTSSYTTPTVAGTARLKNTSFPIIDGNAQLGGWAITASEATSMSYYQRYVGATGDQDIFTQNWNQTPSGYSVLLEAQERNGSTWRALTVGRKVNSGYKIISTFGQLYSCSALINNISGRMASGNWASTIYSTSNYDAWINGIGVEGAMKLLYNMALLAARGNIVDDSDESKFSTSWVYTSPWKSTWVINAENDVLDEVEKSDYDFVIDAKDIHAGDLTPVWKRRLSHKTIKQIMEEATAAVRANPATRGRVENSTPTYELEITNPYVKTASKAIATDYPQVWTEAYTPKFTVPAEIGPYIIKDEVDSQGRKGRAANYDHKTYVHREYPEKPYRGQMTTTYLASEEFAIAQTTNFTARGVAVGTKTITVQIPGDGGSTGGGPQPPPGGGDSGGDGTVTKPDYSKYGPSLTKLGHNWGTVVDESDIIKGFQIIKHNYGKVIDQADLDKLVQVANSWGSQILGTTWGTSSVVAREVELSWWDAQVKTRSASTVGGPEKIGEMWSLDTGFPTFGYRRPFGIRSWQDWNYYTSDWGPGHRNWPYWGMSDRLKQGSTGERVRFLQEAMNRFLKNKFFGIPPEIGTGLKVDGIFGSKTKEVVRRFQITFKLLQQQGIVDAETWYLIGVQMHRASCEGNLGTVNNNDHTKYFGLHNRLHPHQLSDLNSSSWFAKRSDQEGGPSVIWDLYGITFNESYTWKAVKIIPFTGGEVGDIMVRSIHITDAATFNKPNYNSNLGQLKNMTHRPKDNTSLTIPIGPYKGNTIVVGIGQDKPTPYGARMFGIRDIRGITTITESSPVAPITTTKKVTEEFTFQVTGTVTVQGGSVTIQLQPPSFPGYTNVSGIKWTTLTVDNPSVYKTFNEQGQATFKSMVVETNVGTEVQNGPVFPGGTFYSMDESGRFNPIPETGWVSKSDGIKLLCTANKKPYGFPSMPTGVGANEYQRHYVKMALSTAGTDSSVQLSFYDIAKQEFVTTVDGRPEISYLEYISRGPHNIYIAVLCDYEIASEQVIPVDKDAPRLPYRWAMPVYGLANRSGAKITLESLPSRLGATDIWPIAVRDGNFTRTVDVRHRREGRLTTYLKDYQGTTVHAFYGLPEANLGGYSSTFGPLTADIVDEEPTILDDNVIQVRQTPVLMVQYPTRFPSVSDPVRPVFTVYKRATIADPWVALPWTEIQDYNVSTGEIWLKTHLKSMDSSLIRVDYTTTRRHFHLKRDGDKLLNLNTYAGNAEELVGEALYVYIVPHYTKDAYNKIIPGSYQERTLRVTTSPEIFDPIRPEYDPLAIQLGVVYLSTALDLERIAILDTRRRGGGVRDNANLEEIVRIVNEASTYWDIGYAAGGSYQKAGYVVIRLPEELKNDFSEEEIRRVVEKNMTAGVGFKLEDLQGREWSNASIS